MRVQCGGIKLFGICFGRSVLVGVDSDGNEGIAPLPLQPVDALIDLRNQAVDCYHNPSPVSVGPVVGGAAKGAATGAASSYIRGAIVSLIFGPEAAPAGAAGGAVTGGLTGAGKGAVKSIIKQACSR